MLGDPRLVDDAIDAGETLLARATRHAARMVLGDTRPTAGRAHLCGLSHGAGGIGWALLELFAPTGDERFRVGAEGAFAYERSWRDRGVAATWPDLRRRRPAPRQRAPEPRADRRNLVPRRGRHRADPPARDRRCWAGVIAKTPRRARGDPPRVAEPLPYAIEDLTLCHGAAGAADVLLPGGRPAAAARGATSPPSSAAAANVRAAGDLAVRRARGTTPALFRGLSGIGWFFLRLHDPHNALAAVASLCG